MDKPLMANKDEELLSKRQYHGPWVMDRRKRKGDYKKMQKKRTYFENVRNKRNTRKMEEIRGLQGKWKKREN